MKTKLLLILVLTIQISGCKTQNEPNNFDYGKIEDNKYINSYFDFEITIPTNWIVQSNEQYDKLVETGKDLMAGDDAKIKADVEASLINTANLLAVYQYAQTAPEEYNPSIAIVAENIKSYPGVKDGEEYLFQLRKTLEESQFKYDYLDNEFSKETFSRMDFYKMNAEVNYMGHNIKQTYFTTIMKGFSLSIIITYINEEQKNVLLSSLKSIQNRK